ncbi:MAG: hypothetical protein AAFO94_20945, partial [Bacteroidota bacterium]
MQQACRQELDRAYSLWSVCCEDDAEGQLLYREHLLYYSYQADSAGFFHWWNQLHERWNPETMLYISPERMMSYWLDNDEDYRGIVNRQLRLLNQYEQQPYPDKQLMSEAFYMLIDGYKNLQLYDSAVHYAVKSIHYSLGLEVQQYELNYLIDTLGGGQNYRFVSYMQLIRALYEQYLYDPTQLAPLRQAQAVSQFTDSLTYHQLSMGGEESYGNFLLDIQQTYASGAPMQVGFDLYRRTGDPKLLDWINVMMERRKSSLLFKDLINNTPFDEYAVSNRMRNRRNTLNKQLRQATQQSLPTLGLLQLKKQAFDDSLRQLHPEFFQALHQQEIPPLADVQALIRPSQSAI